MPNKKILWLSAVVLSHVMAYSSPLLCHNDTLNKQSTYSLPSLPHSPWIGKSPAPLPNEVMPNTLFARTMDYDYVEYNNTRSFFSRVSKSCGLETMCFVTLASLSQQ